MNPILSVVGPSGYNKYTNDLIRLDTHPNPCIADPRLGTVRTPLLVTAWEQNSQSHPDQDLVRYILKGLVYGFHIDVQESPILRSAKHNILLAKQNPEVVSNYLQSELEEGNIVGPLSSHSLPDLHINRIGAIPKKHQPGKWRLITDLSAPEGFSVNDTIDPQLCSLSYITVQEVAAKAVELGKGSLIAKIYIKSAYRLIPICPHDCKWLGIQWQDQIYVDGMLPFGLRSAPKIFTAVADAKEWCVHKAGVKYIYHYLDDFAVLGSPDYEECHRHLLCLQSVTADLGVPLAPDKQDSPTTVIVFLGIIIDTTCQELRLPEDKLRRLLETVTEWKDRKVCARRDVESLVGILQHACSVNNTIRKGLSSKSHFIVMLSQMPSSSYPPKFRL